jgi:hypothetical protein
MRSQKPASASSTELSTTFVDHVVQAGAVFGVADVHARALAHGLEALENLDALLVVRGAVGQFGCRHFR